MAFTGRSRRYRSTKERPCDACRARKACCVIDVAPPCFLCVQQGKECTFVGQPKRRRRLSGVESSAQDEGEAQHLPYGSPEMALDQVGLDFSVQEWASYSLEANNDQFNQDLAKTNVPDTFIPGVPIQDNSPSYDSSALSGQIQLAGLTGEWDTYLLQNFDFDERGHNNLSNMTIKRVSDADLPTHFIIFPEPPFDQESRQELYDIIAPEIGERLVDLFWIHLYFYVPILSRSFNSGLKFNRIQHFSPCLLATIYLLSIEFWSFDEELCIQSYAADTPDRLLRFALDQINQEVHRPTLSTFQACLCVLQRRTKSDLPFQWTLMSSTVSIAQTLGLHLDPSDWGLSLPETRLRRRCWWALYIHEKMLSLVCGRSSHLKAGEFDVQMITESDFPSDETTQARCAHFVQLARLAVIIEAITTRLHSIRSSKKLAVSLSLTMEAVQPLRRGLRDWYVHLPPQLALAEYEIPHHQPNGNPSLHLGYYLAELTLFRAVLRAEKSPAISRKDAIAFSKLMITFISDLRPKHCQAFWHVWCRPAYVVIGHFIIHLLATANTLGDALEAKKTLEEWRQALAYQSRVCDMMNSAMFSLDMMFHVGLHNIINLPRNIKEGLGVDWNSKLNNELKISGSRDV